MRSFLPLAASLVICLTWAGCNRSPYVLAPVHGKVTIDDKPLFQGRIMFAPSARGEETIAGKPAWGDIGPDGTYNLSTMKAGDGAIVGEHWVTVINSKEELPPGVPKFGRVMAPRRVQVVADKDNQIDIKLTSSVVRNYGEDDR
jgi:hypothetical protein